MITGGFGMTMDLERGTMRQWAMGREADTVRDAIAKLMPPNAGVTGAEPQCGASALTDVLESMRAMADNAYCDYIGQLRRDECLGWEIKVERGKFGEAELKAHCAAAEKLGRHRALHEAANLLEEALRSNA